MHLYRSSPSTQTRGCQVSEYDEQRWMHRMQATALNSLDAVKQQLRL